MFIVTFSNCRAASGIAVLAFGSFVAALGLSTTASTDLDSGSLVAGRLDSPAVTDREGTVTDGEVIGGPTKRPIIEGPPKLDKIPRVPIEGVPPVKIPPITESPLRGNEGVGNGVDPDTPGHLHNGGNDDPGFSPGNPGARN